MKYLSKRFSSPANSRAYVENWSAVFGEECDCRSAYECSWPDCNEQRCMDCDKPTAKDEIKTAVRWCPEHREHGRLGMR